MMNIKEMMNTLQTLSGFAKSKTRSMKKMYTGGKLNETKMKISITTIT